MPSIFRWIGIGDWSFLEELSIEKRVPFQPFLLCYIEGVVQVVIPSRIQEFQSAQGLESVQHCSPCDSSEEERFDAFEFIVLIPLLS